MTLQEINKRFIYKTDKEQFGVGELWTGLKEVDGKLVGDCEPKANEDLDAIVIKRNETREFIRNNNA